MPRGVRAPGFSFSSLASFPMTLLLIGFSLGMLSCWLMNRVPRDRDPDWRRSFNHENTNRPSGPPPYGWGARQLPPPPPPPAGWVRGPYGYRPPGDPSLTVFTEGQVQRGNGNGGPSTGKPVIDLTGQERP